MPLARAETDKHMYIERRPTPAEFDENQALHFSLFNGPSSLFSFFLFLRKFLRGVIGI